MDIGNADLCSQIMLNDEYGYFIVPQMIGGIEIRHFNFNGTKVEWSKIVYNPLNWEQDGSRDFTIYCTDGDICY